MMSNITTCTTKRNKNFHRKFVKNLPLMVDRIIWKFKQLTTRSKSTKIINQSLHKWTSSLGQTCGLFCKAITVVMYDSGAHTSMDKEHPLNHLICNLLRCRSLLVSTVRQRILYLSTFYACIKSANPTANYALRLNGPVGKKPHISCSLFLFKIHYLLWAGSIWETYSVLNKQI